MAFVQPGFNVGFPRTADSLYIEVTRCTTEELGASINADRL